jgi:hypothetical protein
VAVSEQSVDGLDVVLHLSGAGAAAPELAQCRLATEHHRLQNPRQRDRAHGVADDGPLLQPS